MKKFYITTSIPYTNAPPHIGHAFEMVQADVLARYHRFLGEDVFFLTGTDEHGIKTLRAARAVKKDPKDFADEISGKFKFLAKFLNISNDDFIRTTDEERHLPAVLKLWKKLDEAGDIYKKKYKGFYCAGCEAFIPEKDLIDKKCPIHQKELEIIEEENYFFRLSKYSDQIKKLIEEDKIKIIPEARKNETVSFINQGLEDVSFSRSKDKYWSFEVPGDSSQVMYVWMDALSNYVSAVDYYKEGDRFFNHWPADIHCVGKDIMRFHTLFWPAMLLSSGLSVPKKIFVHGFININGQKMSKSLGNVINPFDLINKYGTDAVRYYFLREIPSTEDGDFTFEKFELRYNSDLASGIGNLVSRVRTMAENIKIEGPLNFDKPILREAENKYKKAMEEFKFNEALKSVWEIIAFCDKTIEEQRPWEKKEGSSQVLKELLFILENIARLISPFLPETSDKILKEIKMENGRFLNAKNGPLFPRI